MLKLGCGQAYDTSADCSFRVINYKGESVNRQQIDIKRKTCYIRTWKILSFLDIFTTNIDTLVSSLYQCVETHSIEVF
jgi:hypothetical protein